MANVKITDLTELSSGDLSNTDVFPIVDVSVDTTKKINISNLSVFFGVESLNTEIDAVESRRADNTFFTLDSANVTVTALNVLPSANAVYSLGSPDKLWKDIYLSNGSISLGNVVLSSTGGGGLVIEDEGGSNVTISTTLGDIATLLDGLQDNVNSVSSNSDLVLSNLNAFGSYSNTTFAAQTSVNLVQDNVDSATSSIDTVSANVELVRDNVDSFGSYANSTFSTISNAAELALSIVAAGTDFNPQINTVQDNVAAAEANTLLVRDNVDSLGSYANSTFSTTSNAAELALGIVNATGTDFTPEINAVQDNLDSFASYANTSFTTNAHIDTKIAELVDSAPAALDTLNELAAALGDDANFSTTIVNAVGSVQSNLDSFGSYANTTFATISSVNTVQDNIAAVVTGLEGANTNIDTVSANVDLVRDNVDSLGSYSNTTFATITSVNTVQDNIAAVVTGLEGANTNIDTVSANVDLVRDNVDSFGSYANSTFATQASIDTVQDNVASAEANVDLVRSNVDSLGSYANTTFATISSVNTVQDNIAAVVTGLEGANTNIDTVSANADLVRDNVDSFGSYANSTFATQASIDTVQDNVAGVVTGLEGANTNIDTVSANADLVRDNVDSFGSYANSTFATQASIDTLQDNVDAFGSYANTTFTTNAHIDTKIAELVDSAPAALDTLNELAAALGDDANFSTTIVNAVGSVQSNLDSFGTYANSTFATQSGINAVQDNVAAAEANVLLVRDNVDSLGSYSNSTFATQSSINTVQDNVAAVVTGLEGANTNIDLVRDNVDSLGSYANSTFSTISNAAELATSIVSIFTDLDDVSNAGITVDEVALASTTTYVLSPNGSAAYRIDQFGTTDNPTIYIRSGQTIAFQLDGITGHPFLIQTSGGSNYDTGLVHYDTDGTKSTGSSAQGKTSGTLYWKVPSSISGTYQYQCQFHGLMQGDIEIEAVAGLGAGVDLVQDNVAAAEANVLLVRSNVDSLGSYANTTFATITSVNTVQSNLSSNSSELAAAIAAGSGAGVDLVQDNVAAAEANILLVRSNVDSLGSYANTTFATITSVNTVQSNLSSNSSELAAAIAAGGGAGVNLVQDNVAAAEANILLVRDNVDSFGTYANSTFTTNAHIDTKIAELVDSAPATLDTLNELAAALGDDANFSTTIVNSIGSVQSNLDSFGSYSNTTFSTVSNAAELATGIASAGTGSADSVQDNLDSFASYANATFATQDDLIAGPLASNSEVFVVESDTTIFTMPYAASSDEVQVFRNGLRLIPEYDFVATTGSNVTLNSAAGAGDVVQITVLTNSATVSSSADSVQDNLDSFGSYANSTFSTVSNAAELATSIASAGTGSADSVQSNLDSFGSYANSTFSTVSNAAELATGIASAGTGSADSVQSNLDSFGSYANSTFSTVSNAAELATGIASAGTGSADSVQSNLDSFGSYANSTFSTVSNAAELATGIASAGTGSADSVQSNLDSFGSYANSTFTTNTHIDTKIAELVDSAPAALDTLNELAAALGDDANFSTTIINAIGTVSSNVNTVQDNVATNASSINTVQSNLDSFGSYANSTFSTVSNAAELATSIASAGTGSADSVQSNLDSFASYSNTNFVTITDSGVAGAVNATIFTLTENTSTFNVTYTAYDEGVYVFLNGVKLLQNLDYFANTGSNVTLIEPAANGDVVEVSVITQAIGSFTADSVQSNLDSFGTYANSTFSTTSNAAELATGIVNATGTDFTPEINTVQDNLDSFASYANTSFTTNTHIDTKIAELVDSAPATLDTLNELAAALGDDANFSTTIVNSIGTVQSNLDSFGSYANSTFSTTSNAAELATGIVNATGTDFTPEINTVQDNLDSFASYSNSTFSTISNAAELATGISSSAGASWAEKTANYTLAVSDHIFANTLNGSLVFTLPSSPSLGDEIRIIDAAGEASSNTITVYGNGEKIQGDSSNLTITTSFASFGLVYFNSAYGWLLKEK